MTLQSNNSLVKSVLQEEIIFIDATVEDYQSLIAGIKPQTKIVILDRMKDGVSQITENLQGGKYKAVHIVSHGGEGSLQLGSKQLNSGNLDIYKSQLQQWANFLTDDADILLYGCDVAGGKTGVGFVRQLSQLTGADVAASDDLTGSAALGGDWDLEVKTGKISANLAFQVGAMEAYNSVLASAGDVIINEFSQGSSRAKEWVEILVVKDNLDLQNHRLVDGNNSLDIKLSGSGFSNLKAGTLIVLYNGGDIDGTITPDLIYNPASGDYVLQISSKNNSGDFAVTPTKGWIDTTAAFANANTTDAPRLLDSSGTEIYKFPKAPTPNNQRATAYLSNTASGATDAANWSADFSSTSANPGLPNDGVNTIWINSLRDNNAPVLNTAGNPTLPTINEDIPSASNTGILLADLIKNLITDTNNNTQGIAVTGLTGNGSWQYSFDGGINWTNFGAVSDTSATLLAGLTPIYKGSLNSTPNTQGWLQFAAPLGGTQSASGGLTKLVSNQAGSAGYSNYNAGLAIPLNPAFPTLDPNVGFTLSFDLQVNSESHNGDTNRAGFSVIVVTSNNTKAIELGFWTDEIWAQTANPLFNHSTTEFKTFDTKSIVKHYDLKIKDDTYQLFTSGEVNPILTGSLRNYTAFDHTKAGLGGTSLPYDPYEQTNFVFLGDNTSSAQANINLAGVELQANNKVRFVPNTDYNGTADIKFRAWDGTDGKANGTTGVNVDVNGGTTAYSSDNKAAALTINPINDRPTFTIGNNQSVKTGVTQTIAGWARDFNSGAANETQSLAGYIVKVVNDVNADIFEATPTINLAGDLTYKAKSGITASKTATIEVQVQDSGDTLNGGVNTSVAQTFTITVNPTATNLINGTPDPDKLTGTDQSDRISALDSNDTIHGGLGSDRIFGNNGNDILYGDLGIIPNSDPKKISDIQPAYGLTFSMDDTIAGGAGSDRIYGNLGNDKLYGDEGDDFIWGGDGNDEIWGGYGNDILYGGADKDTFVLVRGQGADIIEDFTSQDMLGCAGALKYSSLKFTKQGSDTLITDTGTSELLATLTGFSGIPNNGGLF